LQGLDTNVLIRMLVSDDLKQTRAVRKAVENAAARGEPLVVGLLTLMETEWVLRSRAGLDKASIVRAFELLLKSNDLLFENEAAVEQALYWFENSKADFTDCLMIARYVSLGCDSMLTFDADAAKIPGGELLKA
jgi:predicted nucleic-acid-binding protein